MNHPRKRLPVHLTAKELDILISGIKKDRHRLGCALMAYGGLRVSEMNSLKIGDINLSRGFIKVVGKGDKQRFVPLTSKLQSMIEKYMEKNGSGFTPDSYLLGKTRSSWHYVVKKNSSDILGRGDIHCHTLRHSFATALYEEGVQLERISELLGHSRLDTTMIYSHISMTQKRDAVMVLDGGGPRFYSILRKIKRKRVDISVRNYSDLVGRERELEELKNHINNGISVVLYGQKGVGKSAILRSLDNAIIIDEYRKKNTIIRIILEPKNLEEAVYKETEKQLKKLTIDELLRELEDSKTLVVIDDITDLSKTDRKTISKLSEKVVLVTATSRAADIKLFKTYIEVKSLKRYFTRQVLSDMIHMNDQKKKESVIDDILHTAGDNLKEAEFIANQLQLGKRTEEISTAERESNQVSIAPALLIFVLFFIAWVLKSYATSMVALSYALLVVFRLVFMRYIFMPAIRKRKV